MAQIQEIQPHHQIMKSDSRQEIHLTRTDLQNDISQSHHQVQHTQPHHQTTTTQQIAATTAQHHQPQQMIITNGQLHNAQIINAAGQILATTPIQSHLTTAQLQTGQICQLVQTGQSTSARCTVEGDKLCCRSGFRQWDGTNDSERAAGASGADPANERRPMRDHRSARRHPDRRNNDTLLHRRRYVQAKEVCSVDDFCFLLPQMRYFL